MGKGVQFRVGAKLVAGVAVGDGAVLGPHSLVVTDIPEQGIVAAPHRENPLARREPSRVIGPTS